MIDLSTDTIGLFENWGNDSFSNLKNNIQTNRKQKQNQKQK